MADYFNDPFAGGPVDDPFGTQQSITPGLNTMTTSGTNKLLVVLFIVDCSKSMDGDRIMSVNAALTELKPVLQDIKNDNALDLKIAIMSFTSSARWELKLTNIDEVSSMQLGTRAGLTQYGNAFHELNKVLTKEQFMKHTGKVAPPAIMFLTDGAPTDDYAHDLETLLKNGWFANASRSAVLMGDAINDAKAREAVRSFVGDPDNDIVGAEESTNVIHTIRLATMHSVIGDAIGSGDSIGAIPGNTGNSNDVLGGTDTLTDPPAGVDDPLAGGGDPFAGGGDPFAGGGDPFAGGGDPFAGGSDPFAGGSDPFAGSGDPFGATSGADTSNDSFGAAGDASSDPFGAAGDASNDPFGAAGDASNDPFGAAGDASNDPFGAAGDGSNDPFAAAGGIDMSDNSDGTISDWDFNSF